MALTRWIYKKKDDEVVRTLSRELNLSILAATALTSLGFTNSSDAIAFLSNSIILEDPFVMKDMDKAVNRINEAIEREETIAVFGDYDVDGIMSSVMVYHYLESMGANVKVLIPERDNGGYGLVKSSVDDIIELDASLIITVDNGVSSHEAIDYANENGIDTIVCDHHIVPKILPNAYAIVDPLREDDDSKYKKLAGVGVALNLISAVEGCSIEDMMDVFGDYAAIGTIADVVPLTKNNRYIVAMGLETVRTTNNIGLAALVEATELSQENLSVGDITYTIVPRLNAAGRMADAKIALDLLIEEDYQTALETAAYLCELNQKRQSIEAEMFEAICREIDGNSKYYFEPMIVISNEKYASGVTGIVCSKLTERYSKPSIVISEEGEVSKGSARSVESFPLYVAIDYASSLLLSYGGHDMAAGFTIKTEHIQEFKQELFSFCRSRESLDFLRTIKICSEIDFSDINEESVTDLEQLAPFGMGNDEPVFSSCSVTIKDISPLAKNHTRLTFESKGRLLKAALFQVTPDSFPFALGDTVDIAYTLSIYTASNGERYVSTKLKAIVPAGYSKEDYESVIDFNNLCFGCRVSEEKKRVFQLDRNDIALVYRSIKIKPLIDSIEQFCYRFSDMLAGKAVAAVLVLKELGLVTVNEMKQLEITEGQDKKELESSRVFRMLS